MLIKSITISTLIESVKDYKLDLSKPLHIGMDFNVDPMSCCVAHIEKDKVYFVDEIVIYSSNTDEMCQEIRDRYGSKAKIFVYPDPACKQRKQVLEVELICLSFKTLASMLKLKTNTQQLEIESIM